MSDKKISIKIEATGAPQAAAEAKKVSESVESLSSTTKKGSREQKKSNDEAAKTPAVLAPVAGSFDQLEKEVRELTDALNKLPVGGAEFVAMSQRLKKAQADLNSAQQTAHRVTGRVSMSAGAARMAMQNVGYQVQDVAVQLASGTGAMRALSQQLPQLASGFGPLGVILGTVAAVALPLAGAVWKMRDSMDDGAVSADEYADKLSELSKKRVEQQIKKDLAEQEKWVEGLKKEKAAIEDINTALGNEVAARRRIEDEKRATETAIREEKIAVIKASDKPESQKAREIAALEAEAVRSDTEGRLTALKRMEEDALREESNAKRNEEAANSTADQAAQKLDEKREEQATAKGQLIQGEAATKRAEALRREKAASIRSSPMTLGEGATQEDIKAHRERLAQLDEEIAEQDRIAGEFDPERIKESLTTLAQEVSRYEDQLKQEEAAYEAAVRESKNRTEFAKTAVKEVRERSKEIQKQGVSRANAHQLSSTDAVRSAIAAEDKKVEREEKEAKRKAEKEQREARAKAIREQRDKISGAKEALDEKSKQGAAQIFNSPAASKDPMARRVATALENGTDEEEISRLQREVKENGDKMVPGVKKGVENMLKELRGQANSVKDLLEGMSTISGSVGTLSNECASLKKQLAIQAKQISHINGRF